MVEKNDVEQLKISFFLNKQGTWIAIDNRAFIFGGPKSP